MRVQGFVVLTEDEQYANLAKERLGDPNWDPAWTFTFDMVAETMSDAERTEYARLVRTPSWTNSLSLTSTITAGRPILATTPG